MTGGRTHEQALQDAQERLRLLTEVARSFVIAAPDPPRLLALLGERVAQTLGDTCMVGVLSPDGTAIAMLGVHSTDRVVDQRVRALALPPLRLDEHPYLRDVVSGGETLHAYGPVLETLEVPANFREAMQRDRVHTVLFVPIRGGRETLGLLVIGRFSLARGPFVDADIELAQAIADHAGMMLEHSRALAHSAHFFAHNPLPMIGFDVETLQLVAANEAASVLYGYAHDELLAKRYPELRCAETSVDLQEVLARIGNQPGRGVATHVRKDGSLVEVEGLTFVDRMNGRDVRFVTLVDVSERTRAQAAQRDAESQLAGVRSNLQLALDSEAKFRAFIEAAPDGIVIVDRRGIMVLVNARTEAMFGYSRDELVGRSVDMLVPERMRAGHGDHVRGYVAHPTTRMLGSLTLFGARKDGSEIPIELGLSPLETPAGLLVTSSIRDVSDRRAVEVALQQANRELEAFSYSVAHDLRAPLRGMNGFAKLLLDRADTLDAEARDCCEEIAANATRMGTLVDALLGLSRLSRAELRREAVDVSALAHEVARELAAVEPERAVEMRIADELHADADPRLLRVMLVNLLGNARKFASKVPHPVVELGTTQAATTHGNRIHAWYIRDNGAGFDPRYASKLFAPFQRLHAARDFPGTGIGLATVQRIVHRHGGEIWAEGEVGKGATFYFTLAAS